MTMLEMQRDGGKRVWSEEELRASLSGNLCRCTGYQGTVDAALQVFGGKDEDTHANGRSLTGCN
jgi:aerobic-type carbon monoxide dehydrogenase small subunit (CoxS/CutS family)